MPTIFIKDGFRFFFYSADWNEPMHVHVEHGNAKVKFWLSPIMLASSYRMSAGDLKKARILIDKHRQLIGEKWDEYFPGKA